MAAQIHSRRTHRWRGPGRTVALAAALLLTFGASAHGQSFTNKDPFEDLPAPTEAASDEAGKLQLRFDLLYEIPLPGPLSGSAPRLVDGRIEIPVSSGLAVTAVDAGSRPDVDPGRGDSIPSVDLWVVGPRERLRYRAHADGFIEAQKRCRRCTDGWKRKWRLRVSGGTPATPVVLGNRVFFGALDNHVYCIKARNGHRIWAVDVDRRVTEKLVLWSAPAGAGDPPSGDPVDLDLVLVVPDGGDSLVALSTTNGQRLAEIDLEPGDGRLVRTPIALPNGHVVVARQKYSRSDASLMVYGVSGLERPDEAPDGKDDTGAAQPEETPTETSEGSETVSVRP